MPKKEKTTSSFWRWLDDNLLLGLAIGLLIFIPLYPKWPLFDILPGYIVRIRLEDFLVSLVFFIWLIQLVRGKFKLKDNPLLTPLLVYIGIGFLSCLSAIFITKTVTFDLLHIAKLFLHFFRRIEYFSLFLIFYSSVKSLKQIKNIIFVIGLIVVLISIYGFGQKYLYWPVYSTMNREFSKGWRLVLTEHARVPATFAGHYDLAAYLAFFLTVFASLIFFVKKTSYRLFFIFVFIFGFFLLILTASRTSFIAYLVGSLLAIFLLSLKSAKKILWALPRWGILLFFSFLIMLTFGDLSERFANFLKIGLIRDYTNSFIREKIFGLKKENMQYLTLNQDMGLIYSKSDMPPSVYDPSAWVKKGESGGRELPADVYEDIPDVISTDSAEATLSSTLADGKLSTASGVIEIPRNYSDTAFVVGLSSAIRFDALWPMAIKGFLRNPLLGSGYSTLNARQIGEFTEAESTDNDYLRNLGETGILGFIAFFGIIFLVLKKTYQDLPRIKDAFYYALACGLIGGIVALLINAFYIDVFEASKVAFTFWGLVGVLMVLLLLSEKKHE